jgi:hypothetical protein
MKIEEFWKKSEVLWGKRQEIKYLRCYASREIAPAASPLFVYIFTNKKGDGSIFS